MVKMGVLGGSGHTNIADYRPGVLVGNWYENAENRAQMGDGYHLLGFGAPFQGVANTAAAQSLQGKTGADLAASYCRTDLTRVGKCVPAALKFHHGDPLEPPLECFATINQLTYGEKVLGEPPVQQYLWSAKTKLNANVPISNSSSAVQGAVHSFSGIDTSFTSKPNSCATLTESKRREWQQAATHSMYSTTSQTAAAAAAQQIEYGATRSCGAQEQVAAEDKAAVGKKPTGPFAAELNKNYHVMKLRK